MKEANKSIIILMAEDDPDDRLLASEALRESKVANELHFVEDGEELMDYLHRHGKYTGLSKQPLPGLLLLDLNMPRKDGREALKEIKSDPLLRRLPVIVLTTSQAEEDVLRSYDLGVNSFIRKPVTFDRLVEVVKVIGQYWFEVVELPPNSEAAVK